VRKDNIGFSEDVIVKTYRLENGTIIKIADSAYKDYTTEAIKKNYDNFQRSFKNLCLNSVNK